MLYRVGVLCVVFGKAAGPSPEMVYERVRELPTDEPGQGRGRSHTDSLDTCRAKSFQISLGLRQ